MDREHQHSRTTLWEERLSNQDQSKTKAWVVAPDASSGCLDCNICLDSAQDPIVTLCGHLYCWPCIYMWLTQENTHGYQQKQCPVCKKTLSRTMLIPLYGSREDSTAGTQKYKINSEIPHRPSSPYTVHAILAQHRHHSLQQQQRQQNLRHQDRYQHAINYNNNQSSYPASWPMAGIFGEVAISVLSWVYGCSEERLRYPNYNNNFGVTATNSRQMRWEEKAKRSLSRGLGFIFCFCVLCLLLF